MSVTYSGGVLTLSSVVTNAQWDSAVGGGGLLKTNGVYVLQANMTIDSTADLAGFGNIVIDLNNKNINISATAVDPAFRNIDIIENGLRAVSNREFLSGDSITLVNSGLRYNTAGNPGGGDPRYLLNVKVKSIQGSVKIGASYFTEQEIDMCQFAPGRYAGVSLGKVTAVGTTSPALFMGCSFTSSKYAKGTLIGVYGLSQMHINSSFDAIKNYQGTSPTSTTWADNYSGGSSAAHWLYLLGSTTQNKFAATGISNASANLTVVGGGYRCYKVIGANSAKFTYFDSRNATNPQKSIVDISVSEMLSSSATYSVTSNETIEFVTCAWSATSANSWAKQSVTGQKAYLLKYGYQPMIFDLSSAVSDVIGSYAVPSPLLMSVDANVTQSSESVVRAYASLDSSKALYDRLTCLRIDNPLLGGLSASPFTINGSTVDFGSINVAIDATASSVIAWSSSTNTITFKSSTFTGNIKTTGTVALSNGATVSGLVASSAGVTLAVTGLNPSGLTLDATYPASVMTRKVGTTTWTRTSTTGSSVTIASEASADYEVRIHVPGYEWQERTVNTGAFGLSLDAALIVVSDLGGSAIFSKTTDPVQMAAISYNSTTQRIEIANTNSSELEIDFTNAYVRFQQILHSPSLVALWENQIQTNTSKNGFVIPSGNPTHVYLSASSTAGAYLSFPVKYADATDARDRFHGTTAGQIQFATSVTTLTVAVPTASENAIAVRTNLATELGRIDAAVSTRSTYAGLTAAQAQALTDLDSMTTGAGSTAKFTAVALENAPASTGGGTDGGSGLTATQSTQLATIHNTLIAHKFDLSAAVAEGATTLPIDASFDAGDFDGHYIVINDGSGSPIQRSISSHTKLPMPGAPGTLTLNAPIPAIASGQTVNILIRTTTQDGAQAGDAMTLTSAERTAVADEVQASIIDEDDGKKVVEAIVNAVSTGGLTESAIAQAVSDKVERAGGKLDKAMKAAQAADDQTV